MSDEAGIRVTPHSLHLPSLLTACLIMVVGTSYPPLFVGATAKPDHLFLAILLCAMSVGFVRGVGLIPGPGVWRRVFSGWSCALLMILAAAVRMMS